MSGALFLAIVSAICVADLLIALRFSRMADAIDGGVGSAPERGAIDPAAARRFARVMFIATPFMWLFFAALSFGIIPVDGITAIKF